MSAEGRPSGNRAESKKAAEADAPKPSILKVIDRFANRESTIGFIEDYVKYVKGGE